MHCAWTCVKRGGGWSRRRRIRRGKRTACEEAVFGQDRDSVDEEYDGCEERERESVSGRFSQAGRLEKGAWAVL